MKKFHLLLICLLILVSQLQAQTTKSKSPRQIDAQSSLNVSYFDCQFCGFGVYIVKIKKHGLPIYNYYRKDLQTGRVQLALSSADFSNTTLEDPCNFICQIYPLNPR